jgi:protoporphyrinogen oxidase
MLIILGAGLAGLSAAYHSGGIVFEKDNQVGGHASSKCLDGFVFDEGIHVLHTKNEYVLNLLAKVGANLLEHKREAWIHSFGVMTRYPFQANTYGLPVSMVKECLLGFIENDFKDRDKIKNYEDWIYFMFGRGIAQNFMIPYSRKFWGIPPAQLTTEWVNVRHPRPSLEEVIEGALGDQTKEFGINAEFRYPERGGFGAIGEALASTLRDRIRLGMCVTTIDVKRRQIEFNHSEIVPYEKVISTLPLPEIVKLIHDAPQEVREASQALRCNSILVVNLGINRPNITNKHWIYYPEGAYSFFRISFPFNKGPHMASPGKSSISAEIAYSDAHPLPVPREHMVLKVVDDLKRAGVLECNDQIMFGDVTDIKYGYVIFDNERKPATKCIHDYLKQHEVYPAGRYGEWAYLWSDEAILSGRKAARQVQKAAQRPLK